MMRPTLALSALILALASSAHAADDGWIDLSKLDAWKGPLDGWAVVGDVKLDPKEPRKLVAEPGSLAFYNGPAGKARDLTSKETFGDVELHAEFLVPKGSNSGIKFQAVYEVQIFDSFGVKIPKGTDAGAVYPRSELQPKYHHIDDGHPPLVNASKAPGEWQTLDLTFIAPRFDGSGKKVADARITAILNGVKVQDDLKVDSPTGSNWRKKEVPTGPILLQGDHGPVSFRNVRARKLSSSH